jgi:Zn-dependent peptidase ImmA (M78 family)/transcriptional regulator with XRE-family HTH domain
MSDRPSQSSLFEPGPATEVSRVFDASRLTQARLLAGMTKQELADAIDVSAAAVGQYEAGITTPRPDVLARLPDVLRFPLAFFGRGRPYARLDTSMAHFRSLRSTRVGQRAKAAALGEQLWELTYALERRVELPPVDLPTPPGDSDNTWADPEQAARATRQFWKIDKGPFRHLVRTMESHGIVVSILSIAGEDVARVDAFSSCRLPRPLVVLTPDRANDVYRHRFTAAHELGHLLLHPEALPGDIEQEHEADRFAAELLTPAAEIRHELPTRIRISVLEEVGREWGISPESLVRRCKELGTASDVSARRAYQRLRQLRTAGLLSPRPVDGYPGEMPTVLSSAFELAEKHGLSLRELADELKWPMSRVTQLLGQAGKRPTLRLV